MAGYVYLIGSKKHRWYKIGKSSVPDIRIRDIGVLLPFEIEILAVWKAHNHHLLEATMHERYAINRVNGEWFRFKHEKLQAIIFNDLPEDARIYPTGKREDDFARFSTVKGVKAGGILSPEEENIRRMDGVRGRILRKLDTQKALTPFEQKFFDQYLNGSLTNQ